MGEIHVKDAASACLVLLKAALEGKADEGAEGLCVCFRMPLKRYLMPYKSDPSIRFCCHHQHDPLTRYHVENGRRKFHI